MTGHGEIIHKNHKFVGKFKDNYVIIDFKNNLNSKYKIIL
jgi:hypothetical protein